MKKETWFKKVDGEWKEIEMAFCDGCGIAYSFFFGQQFHKVGCKVAKWEKEVSEVEAKIERAAEILEETGAYEAAQQVRESGRR